LHIKTIAILLPLIALLQACVAVDPQPTQNEKASAVNVELGVGYMQQNNLELANEKLLKAIRQDPKSVRAHYIYAMLQDRLLQPEKAEDNYKIALELDPKNSEANNNYGAFLCRQGRELEAEDYFMKALENPLYKTPEFAYTNAAVCLLKAGVRDRAKTYLRKALATKSDFAPALLPLSEVLFEEGDHANARFYLRRLHQVSKPTAKSLWLAIRNEIELGGAGSGEVDRLGEELQRNFADSAEFREWQKIR
jgi:type IV pilus assembly protein PilF